MVYFTFSHPTYLYFFLIIPFMILVQVWSVRGRHRRAIKFANIEAIERISGVELFSKNLTLLFLHLLIISAVILALSGTKIHREQNAAGFSYVVTVDASASMLANDIPPTRLDAAKEAATRFVEGLPGSTKMGVVSFAGEPFVESDLTEDKQVIRSALEGIQLKGVGGTDILEAIVAAGRVLEEEPAKAIVLLSDGQLNVDSVEDILRSAERQELVIHTIGIGTREGGETEFFVSKIDEDALKALAYNTGGKYYSILEQGDFDFAFQEIASITRREIGFELAPWLLIFASIVIVVEWTLMNTRLRGIP